MPWQQTVDPLKESLRQNRILKRKILLQRLFIHFLPISGIFQDTLDLGGKDQRIVHYRIIEWFDPEEISRGKEGLLLIIPDRKAEHPS